MKKTRLILPVAGLLCLAAAVVIAATSANYELDPVEIDQGGGEAWSVNYSQPGSIGGSVIGSASSANYTIEAGLGFTVYDSPDDEPIPAPPLLALLGAQTPGPSWEASGATGLSVLQIKLSAGAADVTIDSLTVTASGSGNDLPTTSGGDIFNFHLYVDVNSNGLFDSGVDTMLSQNQADRKSVV